MSDEAKLLGDLVRSGVVSDAIAAHVSLLMDAGVPLVVVSEESRLGARDADAFADAIDGHWCDSGRKHLEIAGPAIVAEAETSTLIGPSWTCRMDGLGYLDLTQEAA